MSGLFDLVQLVLAVPLLLGVVAWLNAPQLIAGWAEGKREEAERRLVQQAELERKIAIAEASIAARERGETFIPPADYYR